MLGDDIQLTAWANRLRTSVSAFGARYRVPILLTAALVFVVCMAWSVQALGLSLRALRWWPIAAVAALVPVSIWFNAIELQLCARAAGGRMSMPSALGHSTTATISNILPIPASIVVRGNALVQSGASLATSGKIILAAGLLWFFIATAISAFAILRPPAGALLGSGFLAAAFVICVWIARRSSVGVAAAFALIRAALLGIMIVRLYFCFAAINAPLPISETAVYALASILGSAVAVVPAGIGVAEGIGALIATASGGSPAAAFLSLGFNRVVGLVGSALVAFWFAFKFVGAKPPHGE